MSSIAGEKSGIRELTRNEIAEPAGGNFLVGVGASLVAAVVYELVTGPGTKTIPQFLGHLKD